MRRRIWVFILPAVLLASTPLFAQEKRPAAQPVKAKGIRIAFFQLEANGVDQKLANAVSDMVFLEVGKVPGATVMGSREVDAMLGYEQKKQLAGCTETSCAVAIAGALGVDKLLMGSLGKVGTSYLLNMKLLDIRGTEAKVETMFGKRMKGGSEEDFLDAIPEAMIILFPASARLWANAVQIKPSPLEGEGKGEGVKKTDALAQKPVQAAPTPVYKIVPWVMVGLGAGAVIGGGVCTGLASSQYDDYKNTPWDDPKKKDSMWSEIQNKNIASYALYGAGAAMIAGGLIWYFVAASKAGTAGLAAVGAPRAERGAPFEIAKTGLTLEFTPQFFGVYGGYMSIGW